MSAPAERVPLLFEEMLQRSHTLKPSEQVHLDQLQAGICFRCGGPGRVYRRNTAYNDDLLNYSCACKECEAQDHAEMEDKWREYHAGCR